MAINTKEASVNQGFIVCLPTNNISYRFIYLWLQTMVEYILTISSGATFKELSKVVFRKELILLPKKFLLEKFDKITKSIFDEIEILEKENINLKKQRDTLLPKLVSGEVLIS
jgi:type I restriction enzyme S subunit